MAIEGRGPVDMGKRVIELKIMGGKNEKNKKIKKHPKNHTSKTNKQWNKQTKKHTLLPILESGEGACVPSILLFFFYSPLVQKGKLISSHLDIGTNQDKCIRVQSIDERPHSLFSHK